MKLDVFFERFVRGSQIEVFDIELEHLLIYEQLPFHHRDPFDRLLVAQARVLGVPLVTSDPAFAGYPLETLW
jgi:PIN domain nuclease of toxin-antitoxin system